ncbi:SDR family NAD(P)-dependent oxidoreductase [Bacillus salitolerans]|uniref:SDR family NAD(P)-dependent oxidoreductase n=1 Tax=Bacillus salitolerans TaxID=1437434 RepID=A0ABW4LNU4_9BACI
MLLKGKIGFVTGATKGIGKAVAITLAQNGAKVIINGRDQNRLEEVAEQLTEISNEKTLILPYDVSNYDEVKRAFQTIKKEYNHLDILVNNAGVLYDSLLGMVQPDKVNDTINVNLVAPIFHMQFASRLMLRQKSGSIINVSSILGMEGDKGQVVYSASKAGLIGATKSAAKELASSNIRVNAVAPGFIETDLISNLSEGKRTERIDSISMNRIGTPGEVADSVLYLASDLSTYVTGEVIKVSGGMVI